MDEVPTLDGLPSYPVTGAELANLRHSHSTRRPGMLLRFAMTSRTMRALLTGIVVLCAGGPAQAERPVEQANLVITRVTPPAWVVRNGARTPLAPETALQPGEILHTGAGGRLEANLGRFGRLHLGAHARAFAVDSGTATLRILAGAFRISGQATPSGVGWLLRLPGLSASVADADLLGQVTESRQHLVLRRGSAVVRTDMGEVLNMERTAERLELAPGNQTATIAQEATSAQVRLLEETGFRPGDGTLVPGGRWRVTVLETRSEWKALAAYDRLRDAGYPAIISPSDGRSDPVYGVVVRGMHVRTEAEAVATRLSSHPGFEKARLRISKAR